MIKLAVKIETLERKTYSLNTLHCINAKKAERPNNKKFQPPDRERDFFIQSGAESNIINIPTSHETRTLHPNFHFIKPQIN